MKFTKRELKVEIYGKDFNLSFPTVKQSQDYAKAVKDLSDDEGTEKLLDFLSGLGLPVDVSQDMESEHLTDIISALVPSKKK